MMKHLVFSLFVFLASSASAQVTQFLAGGTGSCPDSTTYNEQTDTLRIWCGGSQIAAYLGLDSANVWEFTDATKDVERTTGNGYRAFHYPENSPAPFTETFLGQDAGDTEAGIGLLQSGGGENGWLGLYTGAGDEFQVNTALAGSFQDSLYRYIDFFNDNGDLFLGNTQSNDRGESHVHFRNVSSGSLLDSIAVLDASTGRLRWISPDRLPGGGSSTNLFNSNGTLTSERRVNGDELGLYFVNNDGWGVRRNIGSAYIVGLSGTGDSSYLNLQDEVALEGGFAHNYATNNGSYIYQDGQQSVRSNPVALGFDAPRYEFEAFGVLALPVDSTPHQSLGLDTVTGKWVRFDVPGGGNNFANANLTLDGNRTHDGDGNNLVLTNFGQFNAATTGDAELLAGNALNLSAEGAGLTMYGDASVSIEDGEGNILSLGPGFPYAALGNSEGAGIFSEDVSTWVRSGFGGGLILEGQARYRFGPPDASPSLPGDSALTHLIGFNMDAGNGIWYRIPLSNLADSTAGGASIYTASGSTDGDTRVTFGTDNLQFRGDATGVSAPSGAGPFYLKFKPDAASSNGDWFMRLGGDATGGIPGAAWLEYRTARFGAPRIRMLAGDSTETASYSYIEPGSATPNIFLNYSGFTHQFALQSGSGAYRWSQASGSTSAFIELGGISGRSDFRVDCDSAEIDIAGSKGTAGQVLTSNGNYAYWADGGGSGACCSCDSLYSATVGNFSAIILYDTCADTRDTVLLASDQTIGVQTEQASDTVQAVYYNYVPVDVSSTATIFTPPASPQAGDWFAVVDSRGNAGTNNITVDFNGVTPVQRYYGVQQDDVLSTDQISVRYLYIDSNVGWVRTASQ